MEEIMETILHWHLKEEKLPEINRWVIVKTNNGRYYTILTNNDEEDVNSWSTERWAYI